MDRLPDADRALLLALVTRSGVYRDAAASAPVQLAENHEEEMAFEDMLLLLLQYRVPMTAAEYNAFYNFGERHDGIPDYLDDLKDLRSQIVEGPPTAKAGGRSSNDSQVAEPPGDGSQSGSLTVPTRPD